MKIVKLTPLIETLQLLDISDEEYFSAKYRDYISNSKLALINPSQNGSPKKYKEGLGAGGFSSAFEFGTAVHELVLQPEKFFLVDTVFKPTAKLGLMADYIYPIYCDGKMDLVEAIYLASDVVDYYKGKLNVDKVQNVLDKCLPYWEQRKEFEKTTYDKEPIYLDEKSVAKLKQCIQNIENNKEIQTLLHPEGFIEEPQSFNEMAIFIDILAECEGKSTILKLKGKLDNFTVDIESNEVVLNDLKSTGHLVGQFGDSFNKYHYNRQMAAYSWLLNLYVQKTYALEDVDLSANMLLVSSVPNYDTGVFKVTNNDIMEGMKEFKYLLKLIAYYEMNGYGI